MAIPIEFKYEDLMSFSGNFSDENKLGEGGFAEVYKGIIPNENGYNLLGQTIAIKKAKLLNDPVKKETQKKQFDNEKKWLGRFFHPNILRLIGYCFTDQTSCLVLEYAGKGTLTRCISDLDWSNTLHIIKKVGGALQYLHTLAGGYIHGDVKTDNVLITEENEPKLSDFGSFMCEIDAESVTTNIFTFGYIDPERNRKSVKDKTQSDDVYAFAIIILQLVMKVKDPKSDEEKKLHLPERARNVLKVRNTLVDEMLLNTGCSFTDAKQITDLAIELTERTTDDVTSQQRTVQAILEGRASSLESYDDTRKEETKAESSTLSEGAAQEPYIT